MNPTAARFCRRLQVSRHPSIASSRLLRRSTTRHTSTCVVLRAGKRQEAAPTSEERLFYLQSAERRIAAVAVGSLLVGFVTFKLAFSGTSPAKAKIQKRKQTPKSDSGTGMGLHRPLVLTGPSGSGKSTLLKLLFKDHPDTFGFSVSHTTRKPRPGETDGKEYHFTMREEMRKGIDAGDFIEWAEFSGNMYGTSKRAVKDVQSTGKICVLDIDIQGVQSMKKTDLNPLYIFIKPPSMDELEKRLRLRKTESEESLQRRLQRAREEMTLAEKPGVFDRTIVNGDLDKAYLTLKTTITNEMSLSADTSVIKSPERES